MGGMPFMSMPGMGFWTGGFFLALAADCFVVLRRARAAGAFRTVVDCDPCPIPGMAPIPFIAAGCVMPPIIGWPGFISDIMRRIAVSAIMRLRMTGSLIMRA